MQVSVICGLKCLGNYVLRAFQNFIGIVLHFSIGVQQPFFSPTVLFQMNYWFPKEQTGTQIAGQSTVDRSKELNIKYSNA